jgi:hypothetical protein
MSLYTDVRFGAGVQLIVGCVTIGVLADETLWWLWTAVAAVLVVATILVKRTQHDQ